MTIMIRRWYHVVLRIHQRGHVVTQPVCANLLDPCTAYRNSAKRCSLDYNYCILILISATSYKDQYKHTQNISNVMQNSPDKLALNCS